MRCSHSTDNAASKVGREMLASRGCDPDELPDDRDIRGVLRLKRDRLERWVRR
jgi:hypothetical protein